MYCPHNLDRGHRLRGEGTEGSTEGLQVFRAVWDTYREITRLAVLSHLHGAGSIPEELGKLPVLRTLWLNDNLLTGELFL